MYADMELDTELDKVGCEDQGSQRVRKNLNLEEYHWEKLEELACRWYGDSDQKISKTAREVLDKALKGKDIVVTEDVVFQILEHVIDSATSQDIQEAAARVEAAVDSGEVTLE